MGKKQFKNVLFLLSLLFLFLGISNLIAGSIIFLMLPTTESDYRIPAIAMLFAGDCFLLVGAFFLKRIKRKEKRKQWLKANGAKIYADFIAVESSRSIRIHQSYAKYITCQCTIEGITYIFKSDFIDFLPNKELIKDKGIVYYNPDQIKEYYVDSDSFLDASVIVL